MEFHKWRQGLRRVMFSQSSGPVNDLELDLNDFICCKITFTKIMSALQPDIQISTTYASVNARSFPNIKGSVELVTQHHHGGVFTDQQQIHHSAVSYAWAA